MVSRDAPTLEQALSLSIECGDCGRIRWRKPQELYRIKGIGPATLVSEVGVRLVCSSCTSQGAEGRNIAIGVAFSFELDRIRAEASRVSTLATRAAG
jgi:hypothetical protein